MTLGFAVKNDVPVKKEMPSPVKTCSYDEQIKGYFPFVCFSTLHDLWALYFCWCTLHNWAQSKNLNVLRTEFEVFLGLVLAVLDDALLPSMLPLVKREDVTPMEVTSNLQSSTVFKVIDWSFEAHSNSHLDWIEVVWYNMYLTHTCLMKRLSLRDEYYVDSWSVE